MLISTVSKSYRIARTIRGPMRGNIGVIEYERTIKDIHFYIMRIDKHTLLYAQPHEIEFVTFVEVPDDEYYEKLYKDANTAGICL